MRFFRKPAAAAVPSESARPAFSVPNEAEVGWMGSHLQLIAANDVDLDDPRKVGEFYDLVLNSWLSSSEELRADPNDLINLLGTALGECLVRQTSSRWVVASDAHGAELAVHDDESDLLIYPANLVAKRWVDRQPGDFIPGIAEDIIRRLKRSG